jgi:hypothetical protein
LLYAQPDLLPYYYLSQIAKQISTKYRLGSAQRKRYSASYPPGEDPVGTNKIMENTFIIAQQAFV